MKAFKKLNDFTNIFFSKDLVMSLRCMRRSAMTLAEVLITLGIIGVVAAFTIPTLMNNIKDKQFKESAKKAYSELSQAITQIKNDNGGWDEAIDPRDFADSLASKFSRSDTTNPSAIPYRYLNNSGQTYTTIYLPLFPTYQASIYQQVYQFITNDGMFWATSYWVDGSSYKFVIFVDVNNYTKPPNVYGRDVFEFQILNGKLLPMGEDSTLYPASSYCLRNQVGGNRWLQGLGCMTYVMTGVDY